MRGDQEQKHEYLKQMPPGENCSPDLSSKTDIKLKWKLRSFLHTEGPLNTFFIEQGCNTSV